MVKINSDIEINEQKLARAVSQLPMSELIKFIKTITVFSNDNKVIETIIIELIEWGLSKEEMAKVRKKLHYREKKYPEKILENKRSKPVKEQISKNRFEDLDL